MILFGRGHEHHPAPSGTLPLAEDTWNGYEASVLWCCWHVRPVHVTLAETPKGVDRQSFQHKGQMADPFQPADSVAHNYTFQPAVMCLLLAACSNAVCVFELPLGKPLLRHWADATDGPLYYGAVSDSALVIRGISAVYNYDYIEVRLLGHNPFTVTVTSCACPGLTVLG